MSQRLNYAHHSPELFKKLSDFSMGLKDSSIDENLRDLVNIRASQINGCAFCFDMHVKEGKIRGESVLKMFHVAIWRETAATIVGMPIMMFEKSRETPNKKAATPPTKPSGPLTPWFTTMS